MLQIKCTLYPNVFTIKKIQNVKSIEHLPCATSRILCLNLVWFKMSKCMVFTRSASLELLQQIVCLNLFWFKISRLPRIARNFSQKTYKKQAHNLSTQNMLFCLHNKNIHFCVVSQCCKCLILIYNHFKDYFISITK